MKPTDKKLQPIRLLQKAKDLQTREILNKLPKAGEFKVRAAHQDNKGEDIARIEKKSEQFTAVVTKQSICESLLSSLELKQPRATLRPLLTSSTSRTTGRR